MSKSVTLNYVNCKNKQPKKYNIKDFNENVLCFLQANQFSDLYILSDFYEACCLYLNLDTKGKTYSSNISKIRYRLKKMKKQNLIDWRRCGTGFAGSSTFGMTSLNSYALFNDWNI
jgi:hypothetical protein